MPEEKRFVTPAMIENSCLVGTVDQILETLTEYQAAGIDEIMTLPAFDPRFEVLERVGKDVLPNLPKP